MVQRRSGEAVCGQSCLSGGEEEAFVVSVHEGLDERSERRSAVEQIPTRLDVLVVFLSLKKCGGRVVEVEGVGLAVRVLDELRDAVLRVSVRHDPNPVSSVSLVPIVRDVVRVRCVCVEHRSGVGDSSVDSSLRHV